MNKSLFKLACCGKFQQNIYANIILFLTVYLQFPCHKPSPLSGTWFKSRLMLNKLLNFFHLADPLVTSKILRFKLFPFKIHSVEE